MCRMSDAIDNRTYLLDENGNACVGSSRIIMLIIIHHVIKTDNNAICISDEDIPEMQMEPSRLLPERTPKYLELMYDSESGGGTVCDGYEIPRTPLAYAFARHSIVGVAPNRLLRHPIQRAHSLRATTRPPNATIIPLRNGITKRASLCDTRSTADSLRLDPDFDKHIFKTTF